MPDILCSDADHASRSGEPGWSATLGTSSVDGATMLCGVCAEARNNNVVYVRTLLAESAKAQVNDVVSSAFSPGAQQSLLALYTDAQVTGKTNRRAYIQTALDWIQLILGEYATYRDALEAAVTAADARALVLDIGLAPPNVTVTAAVQIAD